jgi:hypothetical protein
MGIFGLPLVHVLKRLKRSLVQKCSSVFFFQFSQTSGDSRAFFTRKLWKFRDYLCGAHAKTIAASIDTRNPAVSCES